MAKKIFIGNYKGGVGKTTSVYQIGYHLAQQGKKVLLLDLDPQSSLSEICLKSTDEVNDLASLKDEETLNFIFDIYITCIKKNYNIDITIEPASFIKQTKYEGVDFIPSSLFYRENIGLDELATDMEKDIRYFSILSSFINKVSDIYDYVIIDCPPNSNVITQSAFMLSDFYIIPTVTDSISTNGIQHYIRTVKSTYSKYCDSKDEGFLFRNVFGERPKLIGIFYTLIRQQVNYGQVKSQLEADMEQFEENVHIFKGYTNNFITYPRTIATGSAEIERQKETYDDITKEMLDRINELS